jgi:IMP dehydrogenase
MKFLTDYQINYDLTFSDVFMVPNLSNINSRLNVSLKTPDGIGTNIPIIVANMNAISGKRMAETVARRGGISIIPQDKPFDEFVNIIEYVKSRDIVFDTPLSLKISNTVSDALDIIHKRAHEAVIIVDESSFPVGIFKEKDAQGLDKFTKLEVFVNHELLTVSSNTNLETIFAFMNQNRINIVLVVDKKKLIGVISKKGTIRSSLYKPAVDRNNKLLIGAAIGINRDVAKLTNMYSDAGVDVLVLDTAHGHQTKMINAIKIARSVNKNIKLVAGNVVTGQATEDLLKAGADIVKVGVGPGAMCTTRMMTGVGRPQFSAILDCSVVAKKLGKHIWSDGGIKHPRDIALALAAGASNVMFGSILAGTYESVGDVMRDETGRLYKENFGMASRRAVTNRNKDDDPFNIAKKQLFAEGISTSKNYINPEKPGVEDIIDELISGVRSSLTYAGVDNISDYQENAVVGIQSTAGFEEGKPVFGL